jgi:hypothetical protein
MPASPFAVDDSANNHSPKAVKHIVTETPHLAPGFDRIVSTRPQQWLYLLGNDGVIYSEVHNRFAGLDAAGVSAYLAFNAGATLQDLVGLSVVHGTASTSYAALKGVYELSQGIFPGEDTPAAWPAFDPSKCTGTATATIEIDGIPVSIQYPPEPLASLCRDYLSSCPITNRQPRCCLSAQPTGDGWSIYVNGHEFLALHNEHQLGLGLLHAARSMLYAQGKYDIAFHAAMVARGNSGILLSAPRECGKSTLAAYLVAQGFDLLTDEPALLHLDSRSVQSLRLPISLKHSSWPILGGLWPALTHAPTHIRSDGTKIRLVHPSEERFSSRPRPLTQIVFPHYSRDAEARAESVSPFHTLSLLSSGGMLLARHISRDSFEDFLKLLCLTPAWRIHYNSLDQANNMLREVGCFAAE